MKNLLCKLGLHKPSKDTYITEIRTHANLRKKRSHGSLYRRNYQVCKRCGKRLGLVSLRKMRESNISNIRRSK